MENKYDDEAEHSLNKLMQSEWEIYVDDLLNNNYTLDEAIQKEPSN